MATQKQLAVAGGGIGLLGLLAVSRQGESFDIAGLRSAYQAELDALRAELERVQEEQGGQSVEQFNQVQAVLSTLIQGSGSDVSEAFEADLESVGGLISPVGDDGGNPDYGTDDGGSSSSSGSSGGYDYDAGFSSGSFDSGFGEEEEDIQSDLGISVGEIRV